MLRGNTACAEGNKRLLLVSRSGRHSQRVPMHRRQYYYLQVSPAMHLVPMTHFDLLSASVPVRKMTVNRYELGQLSRK
jgi:hypothetical protein